MSIEVKNLTKVYGEQKAIDNISFNAGKGQIIGLLGPNGAGKTTTMKILTCFMPASSGNATICGFDVEKDDIEIRRRLGYLPEHNPLYGSMYVREYLSFVSSIHKLKLKSSQINDLIDRVGLGREQNKKISALSKGYKQRVGLAQAIIHDPEVLILDEPISGLDPNQLIDIRNLITDLKKDKTIIFSSHILQEVESICDKVIILDKGKIVADDQLAGLNDKVVRTLELNIEFLNNISADIIKSIDNIIDIKETKQNRFLIKTSSEKDIREAIFDLAVANGNKIIEMSSTSSNLESVFKSVTKDNKQ